MSVRYFLNISYALDVHDLYRDFTVLVLLQIRARWSINLQEKKVKVKSLSPVPLPVSLWILSYQAPPSMGFSRQEPTGGVCHFLLQEIFLTQELNLGLSHCRQNFTIWAVMEVQAEINSASTCFFTCGPPSIILHKLLNELKETKRNHSNKSLKPLGLNILQCFPEPQLVNNLPALREIWVRCLCWEDTLEKRTATPMLWPGEFHGLYSPWVAKSQTWLSDFH